MDIKDISLSPKSEIYFPKTIKNTNNFINIKKTTQIGINLSGYYKK